MRPAALRCIRCGTEYDVAGPFKGCPHCEARGEHSNVQVVYDDAELLPALRAVAGNARELRDMWHYRSVLPVDDENAVDTRAGATPLLPAPRLGAALGIPNLLLKDESRNPTGSFKDRLAAGAVSAARQLGRRVIVGSSSGNAGAAVAAASARAGLPCVMFTTQKFPLAMKTQMSVYGTYLIAAPTVQDRWSLMEEGVDRLGWFPTTVYSWPFFGSNCYGIEGYKTIGYEIADQSAEQLGRQPDHIVFPVGAGDAFSGAYKALAEYQRAGVLDAVPTMHAAEVYGPLERTLEKGSNVVEPVEATGPTVAVSVGSTLSTFQALDVLQRTGGAARSATNEEMLRAQLDLGRLEGLWVETSSALSVAVLPRLVADGLIDPSQTVVAVLTSNGLKDPETTAEALPPIPESTAEFGSVLEVLSDTYGFAATDNAFA
jgi:threonine synthase